MSIMAQSVSETCDSTPEYMELAAIKFQLGLNEFQNDPTLKDILMKGIENNNMAPYYKGICRELDWEFDETLYDTMCAANLEALEGLGFVPICEGLEDHEKGNWREKLEYFCSIGDVDEATDMASSIIKDKRNSTNCRAEASFCLFRIGYFKNSISEMRVAVNESASIIDSGCGSDGDWCCRNKLKVYEAIYCVATRSYKRAAALLLECIPTFESCELLAFNKVVQYTILASLIALPRAELDTQLNSHGIMLQALVTECPKYKDYFSSLYNCHYADFFVNLSWIELEMRKDPILHPHYRHYIREMRIIAYSQILQAYRSLTLDRMAFEFGVTSSYIEEEVARFIASGRLRFKIDKVAGCVVNISRAECGAEKAPEACCERELIYQNTIKKGDNILNQLKKLARVVDF